MSIAVLEFQFLPSLKACAPLLQIVSYYAMRVHALFDERQRRMEVQELLFGEVDMVDWILKSEIRHPIRKEWADGED